MASEQSSRYSFETFQADSEAFDGQFTEFLNSKYNNGWKYKSCSFCRDESKSYASCLFKSKR